MTTLIDTTAREPDPAGQLRSAGMRVTALRVAVLQALDAAPHTDAEQVLDAVRAALGSVSVQAVYDVLHALEGAGLVRRIAPAGHRARFETRVADNHHHAVCRACGEVRDVDCATGAAPCLTPGEDHGYAVDEAEVIYWGLCPSCQANQTVAAARFRRT